MGCCVPRNQRDRDTVEDIKDKSMGCPVPSYQRDIDTVEEAVAAAKENITEEERVMMKFEKNLFFSSLVSKEMIRSLKAEVSDNTVSLPQLKRAFYELNIDLECLSDPDAPLYILIKRFKNQQKMYDMKLLCVLAILIGKGESQEKAAWLFKQYDVDASGTLDRTEISNMINDIITVACECLPPISTGEGKLNETQIHEYFDSILASRDTIVQKIQEILLTEDVVSQTEFVNIMCDSTNNCYQLLWSVGVRMFCKSLLE